MFNQSIGRAFYRVADAARAQQPAHERRLAGAKIACERHDHAAVQGRGDARAERFCCGRVGQMQCQ